MQKLLNLTNYALLSMGRGWKKHLFLGVIYTLVVAFYASVVFFTSALQQETQNLLDDLPELWVQRLAGGRLVPLSDTLPHKLAHIRGVKQVYDRVWGYNFDDATGAVFTVWGTDTTLSGLDFLDTQLKTLDDSTVICGTGLLELRGLQVGDYLSLTNSEGEKQSFLIGGVFSARSDLLTKDLLLLSKKAARRVLGLSAGESTDMALSVYNPKEVSNIARKVDNLLPAFRVVTRTQLQSTYAALFSWRGGIFVFGSLLSVLAFLLLVWERATGLSGNEKKELGILKGLGWQVNDVLTLKLIEGSLVALLATLSGILLAYGHVFFMGAPLLRPFLIGWSVLYPAYDLVPVVQLADLLTIFFLSLVPYLTATLFPAWRGAITDPADAMRGV